MSQTTPTLATATTTSETTPDVAKTPADDKPPARAPESYAFKAPENGELDKSVLDRATPIFRELDLDNAQAQKLVDLYTAFQKDNMDSVKTMREGWVAKINSDPEMAGKLETIKADLGRLYTQLPPDLVKDFKSAMDLTGAGDHPAFVKAFWKLSKMVNEGSHVSGQSPSKEGQSRPGTPSRPTLAQAMYPNNPATSQ